MGMWSFRGQDFYAKVEKGSPGLRRPNRRPIFRAFKILGGDGEVIQLGGLRNGVLTAHAWITGNSDPSSDFEALLDGVPATISGVATASGGTTSLSNMVLVDVGAVPEGNGSHAAWLGPGEYSELLLTWHQVAF